MLSNQTLLIVLIFFGYLLGSIPFGYLVGKIKNVDIRKKGSGATGATNVSRTVGFKYAILVAALDIAKAVLPIYIGSRFFNPSWNADPGWQMALISIAPVLGHIFPVWLKFKGGKGVSVIFACIIMVMGWQYSLVLFVLWLALLLLIKTMSLTNILIFPILPFLFWFRTHSWVYVWLGVFYVLLIWWAHRENIKRIRQGTEPKTIHNKNKE
ncbi:MAG: glycerol-3-phosphate 1-O-acyltransferase PlsY [Candidatus Paceibacterota bacterium]